MKYFIVAVFILVSIIIYSREITQSMRKMDEETSEYKKDELGIQVFGNVICLFAVPILMLAVFEYFNEKYWIM